MFGQYAQKFDHLWNILEILAYTHFQVLVLVFFKKMDVYQKISRYYLY